MDAHENEEGSVVVVAEGDNEFLRMLPWWIADLAPILLFITISHRFERTD